MAIKILLLSLACLLASSASLAEGVRTAPAIVVSIKPLYSLVAQLTEGVTTPSLLLQQAQSPHHYNLRPSQRRQLAQADIIIRVGPVLESFLDKVLSQQQALLIEAWQSPGLTLLAKRGHHEHSHVNNKKPDSRQTDPHIWLSADNAAAISRYISRQLSTYDPQHADHYRNNLQKLLSHIQLTDAAIRTQLANHKQPFISFHDAFQYFEKAYGLNHVSSISLDEETGSSLKHLKTVIHLIREQEIHCLVYQPPQPALARSLRQSAGINTVALDPLGLNSPARDAWFEIMQQLGNGFLQCLTPG